MEEITEIWKAPVAVNRYNVILSCHLNLEDALKPLKLADCTKILTKKNVNDKYIELLQMGWFTFNTTIHFRLGQNVSIDAILEDPYFSYSLDNFEADLTRNNIQSTDIVIAV